MTSKGAQRLLSDMDEHGPMKADARTIAKEAFEAPENKEEKDVSAYIKRRFDTKYGPSWHCIVGSDFKAAFSHESKNFIFLSVGKSNVLLYKSG